MSEPGRHQAVADANRRFYASVARLYDTTETCVNEPSKQAMLERDLDAILALLPARPERKRALDACGGSGNVASKLLRRGVATTVCDVSPDLLAICRRRCAEFEGLEIVEAEIGEYLASSRARFDLIVFSSALHHLLDYQEVLLRALPRLAPAGLLYTVFDPTSRHQQALATRVLGQLDYVAFKLVEQPLDVPLAVLRTVRRCLRAVQTEGSSQPHNLGATAEYHARRGIDDRALVERLRSAGATVVWHVQYADARYPAITSLLNGLGAATSFKLLLRAPDGPSVDRESI